MFYIVMDLEWNQSVDPEQIKEDLPFEIIEIGAVKLNRNLERIDSFHRYIKPSEYPQFSPIVEEMLPYKEDLLRKEDTFLEVMSKFLQWCGTDYIFCTYGDSDLIQLQRNMDYYGMEKFKKPLKFLDIQRIYRFSRGDLGVSSLETAAEVLQIKIEKSFHQAIYDAEYTAEVFKKIDRKYWVTSIDVYNNPKNEQEEVYCKNKKGILYITREFFDKTEAMEDRKVRQLNCACCGCKLIEKIGWFSNSPTIYYALGYCVAHGYIRGKVKVKTTLEGKVFLIKTMKCVDEKTAESISLRREELRKRRRERKKRTKIIKE